MQHLLIANVTNTLQPLAEQSFSLHILCCFGNTARAAFKTIDVGLYMLFIGFTAIIIIFFSRLVCLCLWNIYFKNCTAKVRLCKNKILPFHHMLKNESWYDCQCDSLACLLKDCFDVTIL